MVLKSVVAAGGAFAAVILSGQGDSITAGIAAIVAFVAIFLVDSVSSAKEEKPSTVETSKAPPTPGAPEKNAVDEFPPPSPARSVPSTPTPSTPGSMVTPTKKAIPRRPFAVSPKLWTKLPADRRTDPLHRFHGILDKTETSLAENGIKTEAQLFGQFIRIMGGAQSEEEEEDRFMEFVQYLKDNGVSSLHAEKCAEDIKSKCENGLVLDDLLKDDFDVEEYSKSSVFKNEGRADWDNGEFNYHLSHKAGKESGMKMYGLGEKTAKKKKNKLEWKNGYFAFADFLLKLDGETSVKQALDQIQASLPTNGEYRDSVMHQIIMEFQEGKYTRTERLTPHKKTKKYAS